MSWPESGSTTFDKRIVAGPRSAYVATCGMHWRSLVERADSSQLAALRNPASFSGSPV